MLGLPKHPVIKEQPLDSLVKDMREWNEELQSKSIGEEAKLQRTQADWQAATKLLAATEAAAAADCYKADEAQQLISPSSAAQTESCLPQLSDAQATHRGATVADQQNAATQQMMVDALQQHEEHRAAQRQKHQQHLPVKQRSQEEIDSLPVPAVWPRVEELKWVMKDGSQVGLGKGWGGFITGLNVAAALYTMVSAQQRAALPPLHPLRPPSQPPNSTRCCGLGCHCSIQGLP